MLPLAEKRLYLCTAIPALTAVPDASGRVCDFPHYLCIGLKRQCPQIRLVEYNQTRRIRFPSFGVVVALEIQSSLPPTHANRRTQFIASTDSVYGAYLWRKT